MNNSDLVKVREYAIPQNEDKSLLTAIPIVWRRDHTKGHKKIVMYEEPGTGRLVILPPAQTAAIEKPPATQQRG